MLYALWQKSFALCKKSATRKKAHSIHYHPTIKNRRTNVHRFFMERTTRPSCSLALNGNSAFCLRNFVSLTKLLQPPLARARTRIGLCPMEFSSRIPEFLQQKSGRRDSCLGFFALNESSDFANSAIRTLAKVLRSLQKIRNSQESSFDSLSSYNKKPTNKCPSVFYGADDETRTRDSLLGSLFFTIFNDFI